MLYLYEMIIGVMLGVALYISGYLSDRIRVKLNKPLKYLDFLIAPILFSFNLLHQNLVSRYQITKSVSFKVVLLCGVASILVYYLLNRFIKDITCGFVTETKKRLISQRIYLITKWALILVIYVGVLVLATWSY